MAPLNKLLCLVLSVTLGLAGCSTVTIRTPLGEVGVEYEYTERAYVLGIYDNPIEPLFVPVTAAGVVVGGRTGKGLRLGGRLGKVLARAGKDDISEDYALSQVCIESTVGDWFMRIITIGLYWPSTVTVWIVD